MDIKVKEEVQNTVVESIEEKVKSAWEMERDRGVRARNGLISNIPESKSADGLQRKKEDEVVISTLFTNTLKLSASDSTDKIISVERLGKKEEERTRPRLVKVVLDQDCTAHKVLKASSNLGN